MGLYIFNGRTLEEVDAKINAFIEEKGCGKHFLRDNTYYWNPKNEDPEMIYQKEIWVVEQDDKFDPGKWQKLPDDNECDPEWEALKGDLFSDENSNRKDSPTKYVRYSEWAENKAIDDICNVEYSWERLKFPFRRSFGRVVSEFDFHIYFFLKKALFHYGRKDKLFHPFYIGKGSWAYEVSDMIATKKYCSAAKGIAKLYAKMIKNTIKLKYLKH